jgi:hypothetical protein
VCGKKFRTWLVLCVCVLCVGVRQKVPNFRGTWLVLCVLCVGTVCGCAAKSAELSRDLVSAVCGVGVRQCDTDTAVLGAARFAAHRQCR